MHVITLTGELVAQTVKELQALADSLGQGAQVAGRACNVAKASDVAALADFGIQALGGIDLW